MHNDLRLGHSSLRHGLASPLTGARRMVMAVVSRFANQRFVFSLAALAVLGAKFVHVKSHLSALPTVHLVNWGYSFFAQDFVLLIILRLLLGGWLSSGRNNDGCLRRLASFASWLFIGFVIGLNLVGICFFATSGSEIHWSNIGLAGDAAGRALLLTGLFTLAVVAGLMAVLAWALKDFLFVAVGLAADIVSWPLIFAARRRPCGRPRPHWATYAEIPQNDVEQGTTKEGSHRPPKGFDFSHGLEGVKTWPWMWMFWVAAYTAAGVALGAQVIMCILRPHESSLTFMSWTPTLLPFIDFKNSSPNLEKLVPHYNSGINRAWDNRTALAEPIPFSWLPQDPIEGFEDWYTNKPHYSATADPLRISNLEDKLLPELRKKLNKVPIRHVMAIVLESTRKDVFPLKRHQINEARLRESWGQEDLPEEVLERLRTLTPVAKFLTGDHDDGFGPKNDKEKSRGGLNFNDAYTTSTYTLKSLIGTLCGISPLIADFNLEYLHHIYQPCLPHILGALNTLDKEKDGFGSYDWKSSYMQSVTMDFDNSELLMRKMGFPKDGLIDSVYLRSEDAKFGKVDLPNVNYFGMEETPLEDYIRDQFESAKKSDERVFLTHVTSTSHHPYNMPKNETYVPLGRGLDDLSHYLNAIGYDDRWLGKILNMLDEMGVADETLVVLVGDHGLSIPENDILASYYNPNVGSNHVPLVFSHPKLPPLTIDDAISTQQILPTVLDLLIETGSLSKPATAAAADLLHNYEGQSLLRPVHKSLDIDIGAGAAWDPSDPGSREIANWQFTVINPGRAMVGVRDARHKSWRMVVPVVDNIEWHFTDVDRDPTDMKPVLGFDFTGFLAKIEATHGEEAARWAEEAAFISRWFVEENSKRWRYGPYAAY